MTIVQEIISKGKITNKEIKAMFSISGTAARNETSKLEGLNVIKREGNGKNTHYLLI
jgi:predicted HTH transcriptional regulator